MTGEVSSLVLLSRHLAQRRTAELKALASSWLACRQFGWRLPSWASRPHMAPATTVASHHQNGGFSLSTFSLHASWHSCSNRTTIPGLSSATGQHISPHMSIPPRITSHPQHLHINHPFARSLLHSHCHTTSSSPQPQPPASHAQPSPIQCPVATPTRASPPNPIPPSTSTPAQPSWADLSEELAPANKMDALPTLLPKPNKGKGKGKGNSNKKPQSNDKSNTRRNGFNNSWSYDCYEWYWH